MSCGCGAPVAGRATEGAGIAVGLGGGEAGAAVAGAGLAGAAVDAVEGRGVADKAEGGGAGGGAAGGKGRGGAGRAWCPSVSTRALSSSTRLVSAVSVAVTRSIRWERV
jgi:hypothetical protein